MANQQNVNPNLPRDYQPAINDTNFSAPAHSHLNNEQKSAIVDIAERTGHGQDSGSGFAGNLEQGNIGSTAGGLGQAGTHESTFTGLGGSNSGSSSSGLVNNLRDSLSGSSDSSRRHDGEYNMGQSNIPHNAGGVGRDAAHLERSRNELGNVAGVYGLGNPQGGSHGLGGTEGQGHGSRQAAGLGAGAGAGGLAAAASAQGLGGPSSVDRRSMEQERVGGQHGSSNTSSLTSGKTGHGENMQEAMRDASSSGHGHGAGAAGLGAAGAGAAGASALGGGGSSSGSKTGGLLSQPRAPEGGLVDELEERARKSGTHAAGFGVHGNH